MCLWFVIQASTLYTRGKKVDDSSDTINNGALS